ncbi:hypothetical protein FB451DRAFT_1186893 [Mycena latifolia]|nr:hypothetical protein FB451DRAFT_1186893 [Mycena latifolia]
MPINEIIVAPIPAAPPPVAAAPPRTHSCARRATRRTRPLRVRQCTTPRRTSGLRRAGVRRHNGIVGSAWAQRRIPYRHSAAGRCIVGNISRTDPYECGDIAPAGVENAEALGEWVGIARELLAHPSPIILRSHHERSTRTQDILGERHATDCPLTRRAVASSTVCPPMERDAPSGTLLNWAAHGRICQPTRTHLGIICRPIARDMTNVLNAHRPRYALPWSGMPRMSLCKHFRPPPLSHAPAEYYFPSVLTLLGDYRCSPMERDAAPVAQDL